MTRKASLNNSRHHNHSSSSVS